MVPIFVFGDKEDLSEDLLFIFKEQGAVYVSKNCVRSSGAAPFRYMFIECADSTEIDCAGGVILFKNSLKSVPKLKLSGGCYAVVESNNEKALKALKNSGVTVITCGMSVRDTLSISSLSDDSASVSLQRELVLPDDTSVSPQEIPVKLLKCADPYILLAASAIKLICGDSFHTFFV